MTRRLNELRQKMARKYRDEDFHNNPHGYSIAKWQNENTLYDAYSDGWKSCHAELFPELLKLREALGVIRLLNSRRMSLKETLDKFIETFDTTFSPVEMEESSEYGSPGDSISPEDLKKGQKK